MNKRQKSEKAGKRAEFYASLLLQLKGYKILERRYKTPFGEIDLIASRKKTLAFIEVKKRKTTSQALYSITYRQRKRIEKTAIFYLSKQYPNADTIRFDAFLIVPGHLPRHIKDAWRPDTYY